MSPVNVGLLLLLCRERIQFYSSCYYITVFHYVSVLVPHTKHVYLLLLVLFQITSQWSTDSSPMVERTKYSNVKYNLELEQKDGVN